MDAVTKVIVNGREYTVRMFNPMEAFDYINDTTHVELNRLNESNLNARALGQCNEPENNQCVMEKGNFQQWFSKHPEDMIPLINEAKKALLRPFVKKEDAT